MASQQYQVCLHVGARPSLTGMTFTDVTPDNDSPEAVLEALARTSLTAADLRTRTLFSADPARPAASVLMYAALCGFAGRRLDYTEGAEIVDAGSLHTASSALDSEPVQGEPVTWVQAGAQTPGITCVPFGAELSASHVTLLRSAKRCRISTAGMGAADALSLLVTVSAFRARNGADRLPFWVVDPTVALETALPDGSTQVNGVDLDTLRRAGSELRRARRIDDRNALVEPVVASSRSLALAEAAALDASVALSVLGATQDPETELWHCPRPKRHRNGDANASMKVVDGKVRCFRCDAETVDGLRLVIDSLGISPDDAAALLTGR